MSEQGHQEGLGVTAHLTNNNTHLIINSGFSTTGTFQKHSFDPIKASILLKACPGPKPFITGFQKINSYHDLKFLRY